MWSRYTGKADRETAPAQATDAGHQTIQKPVQRPLSDELSFI
jgi:hypothetical protein